jgi:hypothetical protein
MSTSLFSPRVQRFGERLSLLIFLAAGLWFFRQGWQFRDGPGTGRAWASLGLGGLCFVQFAVLLWVQHRRRRIS